MSAHQPVGTTISKATPARSKRVPNDVEQQETVPAAEVFAVDQVNASFLESLLGYNARRASLSLVGVFVKCMEGFDLKIVEFSLLSLVGGNPGITSRQLCQQLDVLPPNMVGMIEVMTRRGFLERRPHPRDGRAMGLYLTEAGRALVDQAEPQLKASESAAVSHLSAEEQQQLLSLLQKLYR
ncbi:MAG: MarR family winged helix-turn-helix transcriptional regulator [Comamonas sp.]|uniref:MarR family winged helix-turn-helix transcriptional regulator n=1 Tax=Comamonas sp. TaxID=34028 RepID=UPI00282D3811|nr:MarR family winged helix-turn-helix transcriptional regulator [Comamonas sp.]MDR0214527.1 MarR family winged helix-turn-helix transcriptional regulator [Comamonas sp.]MDR2297983.1 MarR family winged helix-turn-helix transcriptional regulator [Comamonas sp.]